MPGKIKDIDVEELSLVDASANRKKFAIIKRSRTMKDLIESLKSLLGDASVTEEMSKSVGMIGDEPANALSGILKTLIKYKDTFTDDLGPAIMDLVKRTMIPAPAVDNGPIDVEKIGAKFAKATAEQIKQLKAIVDKLYADLGTKEESNKSAHEVELEAELKKYKDADALALQKKKDDEDAVALDKKVDELVEAKLAKRIRGVKKSVDGQEEDVVAKSGGPDNFPSIHLGPKE